MTKRKMLKLLIAIGLIVIVTVFGYQWMKQSVASNRTPEVSRMQPIILIPGSSATQERFNSMYKTLESKSKGTNHSLIKVTVQTSGKIKRTGRLVVGDNHPYIVIAFENNQDGYSNIKQQAKWFSKAFTTLAAHYKFNTFSGIGHSNGGLVYTLFLEKYLDQAKFRMTKLMTLGTPFNLEESNDSNRTEMLSDMIRNKKNLPSNLIMYSVAGTENYTSDGIVPVNSVYAGKYIYQDQVKSFTELTVTGVDAEHSDLTDNAEVIQLIQRFLLVDNQQRQNQQGKTNKKIMNSDGTTTK